MAAATDVGEWRETGDMAACRALLEDPSVLPMQTACLNSASAISQYVAHVINECHEIGADRERGVNCRLPLKDMWSVRP